MGTPANQGARLISILDPVVASLAESSRNFWMMGDAAACLERTRQAIVLAREIKHPDSLSFALLFHGWMHGHCGDWDTCLSSTAEAIALGNAHGLVQTMAWNIVHGWALAHLGEPRTVSSVGDRHRIVHADHGPGAMPHFIAMLAEVLVLRRDHTRAPRIEQSDRERNQSRSVAQRRARSAGGGCQLALGQSVAEPASIDVETARVRSMSSSSRAGRAIGLTAKKTSVRSFTRLRADAGYGHRGRRRAQPGGVELSVDGHNFGMGTTDRPRRTLRCGPTRPSPAAAASPRTPGSES